MSLSVARPDRGRSITVKAKLRNAFLGIAAFSLMAAIVGIISYQVVDLAQEDIIEHALPAARHVGVMVEQGATAIDITASLIAATNEREVSQQHARIERIERRMQSQIELIAQVGIMSGQISRFKDTLGEIFQNLDQQTSLVTKRNWLLSQRNKLAGRIIESCTRFAEALRPAIIETTTKTFTATDQIRSELADRGVRSRNIAEHFDRLMSEDVQKLQLLTSMRNQTGTVIGEIEALQLSRTTDLVAEIRDRLNIGLRALARMTIETRDRPLQRAMGPYLRQVSRAIHGADNIIKLQNSYIATVAEIEALSARNRGIREKFGLLAAGLRQAADETIAASTARAERALWSGRISLIVIAVLALLAAAWVIWRYVWTDVAARLDRIATITRKLAAGDLDVDVDIKGTDELGDVADAMRLYKSNAIELQRSNAELEKFAYVASHDLKAPLRGIANLATWIEEDIGGAMTAESKMHLELLKNRIHRLSTLLEDLLQFSRAGREKNEVREFDLDVELPELFRLVSTDNRFDVILKGRMPTLTTAAVPIEQIFRNLFNNAIKHHDRDQGTVTVSCVNHPDCYEFIVQDDGPGIAREFQQRVFGMFQTIRPRDEIEGSGIGLSISQKLVESVDCKIWIHSAPPSQRGTAVHFTWPLHWPDAQMLKQCA